MDITHQENFTNQIYLLGAYDKAIKLKINHRKGVIGFFVKGERYYFNQIMEELIKKENRTKGDYDKIYYSLLDLSNNKTYCGTVPANYSKLWEKNF